MKDVTILLPCLNEDVTLDKCIKQIKKVMDKSKYKYEILVCDNNSIDDSINIAKKNKVKYIVEEKKGYGNTLINGINNSNSKYIVMLDSDLSYDEKDIPLFIKELENGYDLVIGNRFGGKIEKRAMPLSHKIGSRLLSKYSNLLFKNKVKDYHCGLRSFRKEAVEKLDLESSGMEFATEMIIKAKINKLKIKNINTNYYKDKRTRKPHLRTIRDGVRHFNLINKLKFNNSKIFRYFSTFLVTLFVLIIFMLATSLIPQKSIYKNTMDSLKYYYNNDKVGWLNNTNLQRDSYQIDYSADIKSVMIAYFIDENKPISSLIEMNYLLETDYGLIDFSKLIEDNSGTVINYARYWHGQSLILRILLTITTIRNIYFIGIGLLSIVFIYLLKEMFKKDKILCSAFFLGTIVINFFIVPFCIEYFYPFLISFISSIIILKTYKKNKNIDILFLVSGMLTCFFYFLTCETLTLTLPLFIYVYLIQKDKQELKLKTIFKYMLLWIIGYSFMFIIKWIIACMHYGFDFINDISSKAKFRIYNKNENFISMLAVNFVELIKLLFPFNRINFAITVSVALILLTIYYFIFYEKN